MAWSFLEEAVVELKHFVAAHLDNPKAIPSDDTGYLLCQEVEPGQHVLGRHMIPLRAATQLLRHIAAFQDATPGTATAGTATAAKKSGSGIDTDTHTHTNTDSHTTVGGVVPPGLVEWLGALCARLVEAMLGPFHDEDSDLCLEALRHDYTPMEGTRNADFAYVYEAGLTGYEYVYMLQ